MMTSFRIKDFKNFADETLRTGSFTVIVGANASGKSNIRDAFRFLHGIGRGYTLAEIIGGKYGAGGQVEWEPIRGAANEIIRINASADGFSALPYPGFGLEVDMKVADTSAKYEVETSTETGKSGFRITYERLQMAEEVVYEKKRSTYGCREVFVKNERNLEIDSGKPALTQLLYSLNCPIPEQEREHIQSIIHALSRVRFLDFSPDRMREPSFSSQVILGTRGENLTAVLMNLCKDAERKWVLKEWIRELTPMDVMDFEFSEDPSGRVHLAIRENNGRRISAYSASDGTLRFLAMLATLLGEGPGGLYFFEEIENGLHPSRLHLLIDLIERQTAKGKIQVVATTHSPELLSIVNDDTFANLSVVCRLENGDDAVIRPVSKLQNARELRKSQGLGELLAGGWMEDALAFTEGGNEGEAR